MQHLISSKTMAKSPIEDGDAGLILRKDGTVQIFNCFGDEAREIEDFTAEQIETHRRLMALLVALSSSEIMSTLIAASLDPRVVGDPGIRSGAVN